MTGTLNIIRMRLQCTWSTDEPVFPYCPCFLGWGWQTYSGSTQLPTTYTTDQLFNESLYIMERDGVVGRGCHWSGVLHAGLQAKLICDFSGAELHASSAAA